MTEEEVDKMARSRKETTSTFMDVTETPNLEKGPVSQAILQYPDQPLQREIMNTLLRNVSKQLLTDKITHLSTAFLSRHCLHSDGLKAAHWIKEQYENILKTLPESRRSLFTVELVPTPNRPQPSVVVSMKGSSSEELVILGAHEDSITHRRTQREPGAGNSILLIFLDGNFFTFNNLDDASGTATVMEVFRIIAYSNFVPKRRLEFQHVRFPSTSYFNSTLAKKRDY